MLSATLCHMVSEQSDIRQIGPDWLVSFLVSMGESYSRSEHLYRPYVTKIEIVIVPMVNETSLYDTN